jgi:hypothetical protein
MKLTINIVVCLPGDPEKKNITAAQVYLLNYNVKYYDISCNCYKRSSLDFFGGALGGRYLLIVQIVRFN